jgi:hypothetical protein
MPMMAAGSSFDLPDWKLLFDAVLERLARVSTPAEQQECLQALRQLRGAVVDELERLQGPNGRASEDGPNVEEPANTPQTGGADRSDLVVAPAQGAPFRPSHEGPRQDG